MPLLTRAQASAIPVIEWLLALEPRGGGRTTVLAISMIRVAASDPRNAVQLVDPWGHGSPRAILLDFVAQFVNDDPIFRQTINQALFSRRSRPALRFDLAQPILNWLPRGWNSPTRLSPLPDDNPRNEYDRVVRQEWDLQRQMMNIEQTFIGVDLDAATVARLDDEQRVARLDARLLARLEPRRANMSTSTQSPSKPLSPPIRSLWDHLDEGS